MSLDCVGKTNRTQQEPQWATPPALEGGWVLALEDFENFYLQVHSGAFLAPKSDLFGGHCTLYFNKSLLKTHSLQDEVLWKFMHKMLHNAFHSSGTCYIAVCLAYNFHLIEL